MSALSHWRWHAPAAGFLALLFLLSAGVAQSQKQKHDFWGDDSANTAPPGQRSFASNCASCHGLDGRGSDKGADIAASTHLRHLSDTQISNIISNGIAGTGMPAFHSLSAGQIRSIVLYVRTLQGNLQARTPPGDASRGKKIFFGKGECSTCHTISGEGGFLGPDLSTYGSALPAKVIRDEILKPNRVARTGYQAAVVTTRDSHRLEGLIRNEDNFSLQLLTKDGLFHFLKKSDLQAVEHTGQSLMPSNYQERLTPDELNDLVSYIMKAQAAPNGAAPISKAKESGE